MNQVNPLIFSSTTFEHFAPFHLVWNQAGKLHSVSRLLTRLFGGLPNEALQKSLMLFEPFQSPLSVSLFPEVTNLVLRVGLPSRPDRVIMGELMSLGPSQGWMLSGLPPARSIAELDDYGVKLSDLPLHLGIGDFLLANEAAQISLSESERMYTALNKTTETLRKRTESLEAQSIALAQEIDNHRAAKKKLEQTLDELKTIQRTMIQQERVRAMGEMVSGIAHDFNNTLTPITAYASLLQHDAHISDSERTEYLGIILTAAQDAANMIQRLRRLYKPDLDNAQISEFSLNDVALDALALAWPRWASHSNQDRRNIQVKREAMAKGVVVGSESDIRQALLNLLVNAGDAIEGQGRVFIRTGSDDHSQWISIQDSGKGMKPTVLERCREPFFSTKGERGTGLGLPMVIETTVRHGGDVFIESEEGRGTCIKLSLPRSSSKSLDFEKNTVQLKPSDIQIAYHLSVDDVEPSDSETLGWMARPKHHEKLMSRSVDQMTAAMPSSIAEVVLDVLVVDDDEVVRQALGRHIVNAGHRILIANDGNHALILAGTQKFDLVITDVDMPVLRGDELAAELRKMDPSVIILLYTGNPEGVRVAGLQSSNDLIPKPSTPATILARGLELVKKNR